ncbi:hypothetical protein LCGC14_2664070 [marine sediment metagenome]|uniref:Uncharacterized protein n=1 Tax=marine sediment metagenome TaxID=412755 RepID=A0A0F8ZR06_9ZZZZ
MKITMNLPKPERVRADSPKVGDAFMDDDLVFVVISSNPYNLKVRTQRRDFLPRVLVHNLSAASLGWLKRGTMVVPVELEVLVTLKEN